MIFVFQHLLLTVCRREILAVAFTLCIEFFFFFSFEKYVYYLELVLIRDNLVFGEVFLIKIFLFLFFFGFSMWSLLRSKLDEQFFFTFWIWNFAALFGCENA